MVTASSPARTRCSRRWRTIRRRRKQPKPRRPHSQQRRRPPPPPRPPRPEGRVETKAGNNEMIRASEILTSPRPSPHRGDGVNGKAVIQLRDVTKVYKVGVEEIRALNGVSLEVRQNEYV